ncbi:oligopeptide transport system substrate-binding protein [Clostridium collagenovorans DSM 3089]|uniref:Oligopeptide transport system substrate-binding protein n=1 Tax=Clostridium collagenovorans DSM 3089 TaxID=1121306 RepID=A0A1M5V469_9CLOT|nr:peptide ABC transporter substrate-binding protein [Clostridium collagenovorans]SHH69960.1 oligopeptide transport system substrate-binding protein [Clostridium collagenovorans DSM 3089]
MKSKKILATILAVSVLSTSALVGCSDKKDSSNGGTGSASGQKDKEQYLNLFGGEPQILDPTIAGITTTWQAVAPINEGLTRVEGSEEPGGPDKIVPGVAESWESNDDSTEFTFKLRKDSKWQDGTPVTANDFVYSLRRVCDPRVASDYSSFISPIIKGAKEVLDLTGQADATIDAALENVGVKAVDDYTLKFELVKPTPYFLQFSYFPTFRPVQKAAIEKFAGKYGTEAEMTMANGPYILSEWKHNGVLVYEKNPNYWDKDNVFIEKVTKTIVEDANSAMQALYNGEVDRGNVNDPQWVGKFDSSDKFNIEKVPAYDVESLVFNLKEDRPTGNIKIRKALAASVDRKKYSEDISNGNSIPGFECVPENVSIDGKSYQERLGNPKYVKKLIDEVKDPKALLIEGMKEAGLGDDPSKLKISINTRGDNAYCKKQGEWFQNKWKEALGINLEVISNQYQIMYENMQNGNFDIAVGSWLADFDDPSNFLDVYASDGIYSYLNFNNKEYDEKIEKSRLELDPQKRAELLGEAEKILTYDEVLISPFEHSLYKMYTAKYVKNYRVPGLAGFCMDYKGVYTSGR